MHYRLFKRKTAWLFLITLLLVLTVFFLPKPTLLEETGFSKAIYDEQNQLLRLTLSPDQKFRVYTRLSAVSKQLIEATLMQEDRYFYWHFGVNPIAVLKAFWQTYVLQSRRLGASTISMQLARLRYGIHSKKVLGKVWQILCALQLELHYSKDQILEAYFNLVPYGANVEGVGAASLIYFQTQADRLNLAQALTLSLIPQNPKYRSPEKGALQALPALFFRQWLERHPEDSNKKGLFSLPLVMYSIRDLPFKAPHLVNKILADKQQLKVMRTSLDSRSQVLVERITRNYLMRKKKLGVVNAAVLLVDTRDRSVKALLGSADFFDKKIEGQINGTETKRSPGSTLKPFIYALALDQGLIHPNTVLKDVASSFNGYNPENFDYDFMGPIKAKDALILSRNIPAVYLASQLRRPNLHRLLEQAQIRQLKPESSYGLALNLGGVELTMRELVSLYVMLVNEGVWFPIHWLKGQEEGVGRRLLSPEASYLVLDMLKSSDPQNPDVAWKTGTSSGFRDAWTLGSFGPYVMGVWLGNFDNRSNLALIGKNIAAPLFFELVTALKQERGPLPSMNKNPGLMNLRPVEVCKASGMLPTRYCRDREWTWFIPGKSPIKTDTVFREVAINPKTGLRTCHINKDTYFEIFEFWSSDLLKIFKRAGVQRHSPPFFEADCALSLGKGMNPQITSPQKGLSYLIRSDSGNMSQIPLSAVTDAGIQYIYWFVNDQFLSKVKAGSDYLWAAKPGKYLVRVVDDQGLSDAQDVSVRMSG